MPASAYADLTPVIAGMRAEGRSLRQIVGRLNAEGHTTRQGKVWNAMQVARLINIFILFILYFAVSQSDTAEAQYIISPNYGSCSKDNDCDLYEDPCSRWGWIAVNKKYIKLVDHITSKTGGINCMSANIDNPKVRCIRGLCDLNTEQTN